MVFLSRLGSSVTETLLGVIALLMALCIAIPFHEFAHAFVAKKEGDFTAVAQKRCTPAALAHFDFYGFLLMMLFGFGWAKPVPIDSRNFKRGRKSLFLVSVAGVVVNLILGILFLFIYMVLFKINNNFMETGSYGYLLGMFLYYSYSLNFGLAIFNLLPIYPFDGYNILNSFCRYDNAYLRFAKKYSTILLMIILFTGIYRLFYGYVIDKLFNVLVNLFGKILGL